MLGIPFGNGLLKARLREFTDSPFILTCSHLHDFCKFFFTNTENVSGFFTTEILRLGKKVLREIVFLGNKY
jgi:hypothetical protein